MLTNHCYQGDCRDVMRTLIADGVRVQCIVTSPPYWGLRDYGVAGQLGMEPTLREFIANMVEVFDLCRELLTDDGTLWLNMGDSYAANRGYQVPSTLMNGDATNQAQAAGGRASKASDAGLKPKDLVGQPWRLSFALQDAGWWLRQDIIWHKPNPMPESVRDRCTKAHEYLFLFSKSERYFFDADAIKEPATYGVTPTGVGFGHDFDAEPKPRARGPGNVKPSKGAAQYEAGDEQHRTKSGLLSYAERVRSEGGNDVRNKRSVWTIPTNPYKGAHFATFPEALVEPCVLAGTRPGDIVFDPFMGSGTVASVAQRLGRRWLGAELNPEYIALQAARTRQPALALEVMS